MAFGISWAIQALLTSIATLGAMILLPTLKDIVLFHSVLDYLLGPLFGPLKVIVVMIVALLYFKRYTSTSLVSSFIYLFIFFGKLPL